jgi:acyl carrier protein
MIAATDARVVSRLRWLVARELGVDEEALADETSLRDDLAADSLDLLELALVLEGDLGAVLPEAIFDGVSTYGELVGAIVDVLPADAPRAA